MKTDRKITGTQVLGEVETDNIGLLKDYKRAKQILTESIKSLELTEVGSFYYEFPGGGFTGVVSLVESHIAIHTWPEVGAFTLDVYLCNYPRDNSKKCGELFDRIAAEFSPTNVSKQIIPR